MRKQPEEERWWQVEADSWLSPSRGREELGRGYAAWRRKLLPTNTQNTDTLEEASESLQEIHIMNKLCMELKKK